MLKMQLSVLLSALLTAALAATSCSDARTADGPRVIAITANQYQFSPAEITLKRDQPVTLQLTSTDVTHGFFMKRLKLDADIVPGRKTDLTFTPHEAGKFNVICVHYCGPGHGAMHMTIVVE